MNDRVLKAFLFVIAFGLLTSGIVAVKRSTRTPDRRLALPLGDTLQWLELETVDSAPINLHARIAHRPALIYIVNEAECASCSNLPLESRIVQSQWPNVQTVLVGSGSAPSTFARFLTESHAEKIALIDEKRTLLHSLGFDAEPLAVLVDSTGRILYMDLRSTSKAAQYPLGRILFGLQQTLKPSK
jgi:hypothetical protein